MSNWHIMCMPACIIHNIIVYNYYIRIYKKYSGNSYACNKIPLGSVEMHGRVVGMIKLIIDDAVTIAIHE